MPDPNKPEQVIKPAADDGAAPVPANPSEKVASPEVKTEVVKPSVPAQEKPVEKPVEPAKPEVKEPITVEKQQEQIDNLNVALREAREESKTKVDQSVIVTLEKRLEEAEIINAKQKEIYAPEPTEPVTPQYLTAEQADDLFKQKTEEAKQEAFKEKQAETIKSEIGDLEKKWDGKDGKPKYSDEETLKWQQDKNMLYLSPKQAFKEQKHDEILDWEVKQRLAGKKPVENVEQPGVSPDIHTPAEEIAPTTDQELRQQVEAAINTANAEL